jgi:signal transduction histidine kinase
MSERRRAALLAGIIVTLAIVGLLAEWLYLRGRPQVGGLVDLATGWALGGCGVIAWATVPRSRLGPLLLLTSLAWFVGTPRDPGTDVGRIAIMALYLYAGPLVQALVTWPTGRATRPLERVLITGGYVIALFAPVWQRDIGVVAIAGLLAVSLAVQHLTLPSRERATRGPALVAGAVLVGGLLAKQGVAQLARDHGLGLLGDPDALWSVSLVAAVSLLVGGAIALERRRAHVTDLVIELGDGGTGMAAVAVATSDPALRAAVARAEAMLERNVRLRAELDQRARAVEASRRRLLEAEDEERQLLERRLRTGPARHLEQLAATIDGLASGWAHDRGALTRLRRSSEQLAQAAVELEGICRGLDPVLLADGLAPALYDLAGRSPVPVTVDVVDDIHPTGSVGVTLYYVASEALANVIRHAHATRATLRLSAKGSQVSLAVEDDGVGGADPGRGTGLRGLRDRLEALGGRLLIDDTPTGGTLLAVTVPAEPAGVGV